MLIFGLSFLCKIVNKKWFLIQVYPLVVRKFHYIIELLKSFVSVVWRRVMSKNWETLANQYRKLPYDFSACMYDQCVLGPLPSISTL